MCVCVSVCTCASVFLFFCCWSVSDGEVTPLSADSLSNIDIKLIKCSLESTATSWSDWYFIYHVNTNVSLEIMMPVVAAN